MRFIRSLGDKFGTAGELFGFMFRRRIWWMIPLVALLLVFSLIIVLGQSTPLGPFIYTLF